MVTTSLDRNDPLRLPGLGESWWVLYTRSRREKQIARACESIGIRHYLPLCEGRPGSAWGPRGQVPLFPGYVFVCPTRGGYGDLLRTGSVVRGLAVSRPEVLVGELRSIRAACEAGVYPMQRTALIRGRRVRVVGGPLVGVTGLVADRRMRGQRLHLVLNVTLLGQGAMVELDATDVEPVGGWQDPGGASGPWAATS